MLKRIAIRSARRSNPCRFFLPSYSVSRGFCTAIPNIETNTTKRQIPKDGPTLKDFLTEGHESSLDSFDQEIITTPPYLANHSPGAGRWDI